MERFKIESDEQIYIPLFGYRSPPPCRTFWGFEGGGGTVENQDPSGACGGLFDLIFFYLYCVSLSIVSFDDGDI